VRLTGQLLFPLSLTLSLLVVGWLYSRDEPLRSGVAFHHLASVRELARGRFPPRHNLVEGKTPQGHYGPYLVFLGAVTRWTRSAPMRVLCAAGLVNLLVFSLAFRRVCILVVGEGASRWSALVPFLLWGPWPARVMAWPTWGWPGPTSFADAHNFFYPQEAALVLLLLVVALIVSDFLGEPKVAQHARYLGLWTRLTMAMLLAGLLVMTHPLTGVGLGAAVGALAVSALLQGQAKTWHLVWLIALPVAVLGLASLWQYYPVLGLLKAFTIPGLRQSVFDAPSGVGESTQALSLPFCALFGPALVGLVWAAHLALRQKPFLLLWSVAVFGLAAFPLLPLRQRVLVYAAIPLQLAAAGLLEALWGRGKLGMLAAITLLGIGGASVAQRVDWLLAQEPLDLDFVSRLTDEDAVVLSDGRTSNAVAGLTGRKIVAPEGPDMFLVMGGGWQRVIDVERFMDSKTSDDERATILRRWHVSHVLVDRLVHDAVPTLPYPLVYDERGYLLYDTRAIGRSLDLSPPR